MADFPALPLFTDAFIADTIHLDAEETGAYLMLLMCAWRTPNCTLPNDNKKLARFARCTPARWKAIKDDVMQFWTLEGDVWCQKRLKKERNFVEDKRAKNTENGKRGGRPKSLENNEPEKANGSVLLNPNQNPNETQTKANPHPHPQPIEKSKQKKPKDILLQALSDEDADALIEHRKNLRAPFTNRSAELAVSELRKLSGISTTDAVNLTIERGWRALKAEWCIRELSKQNPQGPASAGQSTMIDRMLREEQEAAR